MPSRRTKEPMLDVEDALARVLDRVGRLDVVRLPLRDALGHVVAGDLRASDPLPRFANSAMDGFALRGADAAHASESSPIELEVIGEVRAGEPGDLEIGPGTAARIMTGAPMPQGADAVVPVEETDHRGKVVAVKAPTPASRNVRPAGDDLAVGDVLVHAGQEIGPGEVALLASMGLSPLEVVRSPRVAILVTGDELVPPESRPGPGQIRDSNSIALDALTRQAGGQVVVLEHVADTFDAHRLAFERAARMADVVISSGGVAVGEYDFVKDVVEELGRIDLWRVAMQPGKPVVLGDVLGTPFLGLPGNPVSVHVSFEQFVRPALRKMRGCKELLRPVIKARLTSSLDKKPGRLHFVRVRLARNGETWDATPTGPQGSHIQSSLVGCHGVARFGRDLTHLEAGSEVEVEVWGLPGRG